MAISYANLSKLSRKDLIKLYDKEAKNARMDFDFIRQEIWRRDLDRFNRRLEFLTVTMCFLTAEILIFTILTVLKN